MPAPVGTGNESIVGTSSRARLTHYLPGVVDAISSVITTRGAKVSHTHPARAGDESMAGAPSRERLTHYLPYIVDARSKAFITA